MALPTAVLVEQDFGRYDEPDLLGCAVVTGTDVAMYVRPNLEPWLLALVWEWVVSRSLRLCEHGPEPDGWAATAPGQWQMWVRLKYL